MAKPENASPKLSDLTSISVHHSPESSVNETNSSELDVSAADKIKIQIIQQLFKQITGQEIQALDSRDFSKPLDTFTLGSEQETNAPMTEGINNLSPQDKRFEYYEHYSETERLDFVASGEIHTAKGETLSVNLSMSLSREFVSEHYLVLAEQAPTDPLVINFSSNGVKLSNQNFKFDLNSNGETSDIAFVQAGSGFLALDKNNNGKIDNGSELFGPTNGNGFSELEEYDSDNNKWIDEQDSIFNELKLWAMDSSGNTQLFSLADKGIGAISLSSIKTPFMLKDQNNQSLGEVASTGIALKESGEVSSIQQINLFV